MRCAALVCDRQFGLQLMNGAFYCSFHRQTSCDAWGCNHVDGLCKHNNGKFCSLHSAELKDIRSKILRAKCEKRIDDEIFWRLQELTFRKWIDKGHRHYIDVLERKNVGQRSSFF
jgi:hypothetical protein